MEIENLVILERAMGIGPTYSAWKAAALPLCYARISLPLLGKVLGLYTTFSSLSRGTGSIQPNFICAPTTLLDVLSKLGIHSNHIEYLILIPNALE